MTDRFTSKQLTAARRAWIRGCENALIMRMLGLTSYSSLWRISKAEGWPRRPKAITKALQSRGGRHPHTTVEPPVLRRCGCGQLTTTDPCRCGAAWQRSA